MDGMLYRETWWSSLVLHTASKAPLNTVRDLDELVGGRFLVVLLSLLGLSLQLGLLEAFLRLQKS
jgi:hypothetical protein